MIVNFAVRSLIDICHKTLKDFSGRLYGFKIFESTL